MKSVNEKMVKREVLEEQEKSKNINGIGLDKCSCFSFVLSLLKPAIMNSQVKVKTLFRH